jgi:hypothetical protein
MIYIAAAVAADGAPGSPAAAPQMPPPESARLLAPPPPVTPPKVVYLYTSAQLDQLRKDNPKHYAQAERILAAGRKLCGPGPESLMQVGLDVHDLQCDSMALRTSLPPKVDLHFRLDDTVYIARVVVTDARANAIKVK